MAQPLEGQVIELVTVQLWPKGDLELMEGCALRSCTEPGRVWMVGERGTRDEGRRICVCLDHVHDAERAGYVVASRIPVIPTRCAVAGCKRPTVGPCKYNALSRFEVCEIHQPADLVLGSDGMLHVRGVFT